MVPPFRISDPAAMTGGRATVWKAPWLRGRCGGAVVPISLSTSENLRLMVAVFVLYIVLIHLSTSALVNCVN
eukprot:619899-Prymnesium_polylepis.1